MKGIAIAFVIGCLVAGAGTYAALQKEMDAKVSEANGVLGGYTKYSDYLTVGEQSLQEQSKFLAATVLREETYTREIQRKVIRVIPSDATVAITYTGEYSFGYDLKPNSYRLIDTALGIEVVLANKPTLVASPAFLKRSHKFPNRGWLINEEAETLKLYEGMDDVVRGRGLAMASEEAVIALCEKKLVAFLKDFLSKQPGVKKVPNITVSYKT